MKQNGVNADLTGGGLDGAVSRLANLVVSGRQSNASLGKDRDAALAQVQALTASVATIQATRTPRRARPSSRRAADAQDAAAEVGRG